MEPDCYAFQNKIWVSQYLDNKHCLVTTLVTWTYDQGFDNLYYYDITMMYYDIIFPSKRLIYFKQKGRSLVRLYVNWM